MKIKDLLLKDFYIFLTKQIELGRPLCLGKNPLDFLKEISIEDYLKKYGDREAVID